MRAAARLAALWLAPVLFAGCVSVEGQVTYTVRGNLFAGMATAVMRPVEMVTDVARTAGAFRNIKGKWPTSRQELRLFWDEMGEPRPAVRWASFSRLEFRPQENDTLEIDFAIDNDAFDLPGGGQGTVSGTTGRMTVSLDEKGQAVAAPEPEPAAAPAAPR